MPLAQSGADKKVRVSAYIAAAEVYLRLGRFGDAYAAMKSAQTVSSEPLDSEIVQAMEFAKVLVGQTPMAVTHKASGRLDLTHDMAGLVRVPVRINGQAQDAVIDSGAGFSTLSETAAKRLGVRLFDETTSVASASKDAVATRLGVADKLEFGDAVLSNVVFVVLPDAALTFAGGKYKIDAIMGLPVFVALNRIEMASEAGKDSLYYGAKPGVAPGEANLLLAGVEPLVLVNADKASGPLRLFIDTGALHTTLNSKAVKDYPALGAAAVNAVARWEGAGGETTDEKAQTIPELTLVIAGRPITVKDIRMVSKTVVDRHGSIGQDVLKQGHRWTLDFENMRFSVED
jgi:predicted aspartyl protease